MLAVKDTKLWFLYSHEKIFSPLSKDFRAKEQLGVIFDPSDKKTSSSANAVDTLAIRDPPEGSSDHEDVTVTNLI
jgi:hypothetical protein